MLDPELSEASRHSLASSLDRVPLTAPSPSAARYRSLQAVEHRSRRPVLVGAVAAVAVALILPTLITGSPSPLVWAAEAGGSLEWLQSGPVNWLPFESTRPSPEPATAAIPSPAAPTITTPQPRPSNGGASSPAPISGGTSASPSPQPTVSASPAPTTSGSNDTPSPSPLPSPSPSPSPKPSPSPSLSALGTLNPVTPNPATIGQDIFVTGSGWTPGARIVLTLVQGTNSDTLSDSVQVSSSGQISWNGGVPGSGSGGQFLSGAATVTACYQGTTKCQTAALSLVAQTH